MGPKTLPTIWGTYMKLVTKYQISAINIGWEKWAYMFNVYKNQQSRQTGSRNLTGPKTLPTIWGIYMKLVTKYQISAINICPHIVGSVFGPIRFLLPVCRFCWFLYTFNIHLYMHIFRRIFLSNYWWQKSEYMFNVYKNQLIRQTGSRNLMGPKMLPTIWYTYTGGQ
jgi:hypothetical protein